MATYNYIKPHWRSGPHAVHDAPDWALAVIEQTLSSSSSRVRREFIRIDRCPEVGLSIALAQRLFEEAYGTSIITGVGSHQRILGQLDYPDDRDVAANFFAERSRLRSDGSSAGAVGSESFPTLSTSLSSLLTHQSPAPVLSSDDEDAAPVRGAEPDLEAGKQRSTRLCPESLEVADALSSSSAQAASGARTTGRWVLAAGLLALGVILGAAAGPLLSR